jgi:hypothetical protein
MVMESDSRDIIRNEYRQKMKEKRIDNEIIEQCANILGHIHITRGSKYGTSLTINLYHRMEDILKIYKKWKIAGKNENNMELWNYIKELYPTSKIIEMYGDNGGVYDTNLTFISLRVYNKKILYILLNSEEDLA